MRFRTAVLVTVGVLFVAEVVGFSLPQIEWLDVPFHIAGGFAWAMMAAWVICEAKAEKSPWWFNLGFTVGLVMFIGSSWETLEFLLVKAQVFPATSFTFRDTIGDLFNDGIGSLIGWYLFVKNLK